MEVDKQDMVVQIISGFRGSGKTTFLKMIAGLEEPDNGQIINV